jgi:hypothetical protein
LGEEILAVGGADVLECRQLEMRRVRRRLSRRGGDDQTSLDMMDMGRDRGGALAVMEVWGREPESSAVLLPSNKNRVERRLSLSAVARTSSCSE